VFEFNFGQANEWLLDSDLKSEQSLLWDEKLPKRYVAKIRKPELCATPASGKKGGNNETLESECAWRQ
jgi:hypothetical protein